MSPTTVELDEPVTAMAGPVEVLLRVAVAGKIEESSPERAPASNVSLPPSEAFGREPTLDELAAEQGIITPQPFEQLLGQGHDLWENDEEFEAFLRDLDALRHPERANSSA